MNLPNYYKKKFHLEDYEFELIDSKESMVSHVYKIKKQKDTHFILKICPREEDYHREKKFLAFFEDKIPVPGVIKTVEPSPDHFGALLLENLKGNSASFSFLSPSLLLSLGKTLAKIHSCSQKSYGDLTEPEKLVSDPKIPFANKFKEGLKECTNHLPHKMLDFLEIYLNKNLAKLNDSDGPCIIHRDFRPSNVIINGNEVKGIIDWSSARSSFAEDDFCPFEIGEWPLDKNQKQSFLDGYKSIRPLANYKEIMPLLCVHRALAVVGFTVKKETFKTVHSKPYTRNRKILEDLV